MRCATACWWTSAPRHGNPGSASWPPWSRALHIAGCRREGERPGLPDESGASVGRVDDGGLCHVWRLRLRPQAPPPSCASRTPLLWRCRGSWTTPSTSAPATGRAGHHSAAAWRELRDPVRERRVGSGRAGSGRAGAAGLRRSCRFWGCERESAGVGCPAWGFWCWSEWSVAAAGCLSGRCAVLVRGGPWPWYGPGRGGAGSWWTSGGVGRATFWCHRVSGDGGR